MKITKSQLRQIAKEELNVTLKEFNLKKFIMGLLRKGKEEGKEVIKALPPEKKKEVAAGVMKWGSPEAIAHVKAMATGAGEEEYRGMFASQEEEDEVYAHDEAENEGPPDDWVSESKQKRNTMTKKYSISKTHLKQIIAEEHSVVLMEQQLALIDSEFADSEFLRLMTEQFNLSKKEARLLKESFMSKTKEILAAAKEGVKTFIEYIVGWATDFFSSYGSAQTAKGAVGLILTQTSFGQEFLQSILDATANSNVLVGALPKFQGVVDWLLAIPPENFAAAVIIGLAYKLITWVVKGGFKKLGFELKSNDMMSFGGAATGLGVGPTVVGRAALGALGV